MTMRPMLATILGISLLLPGLAAAQPRAPQPPRAPGVDAREHRQATRIRQGVRQGTISRGEARRLQREQARLRQEERLYRRSGGLNPRERADLQRDLNQANRHIRRAARR